MKLVMEGGLSILEIGAQIIDRPSTISYWVRAKEEGNLSDAGKGRRWLTETEMELAQVKRELADVKRWSVIWLKKAAACFAKRPLPGTRS